MNTDASEELEIVPDAEDIGRDATAKIKKQKDEIERLEKERREYLEGWQRAKADFINYKKDEGKRLENIMRFASADFMEDILPVLDSFDLALATGAGGNAGQGMVLIRSQLESILKKRGVTEIAVRKGDPFNPESHESIGETASEYPAGAIAEVSQRGYECFGRVLRPTRVKLSNGLKSDFNPEI